MTITPNQRTILELVLFAVLLLRSLSRGRRIARIEETVTTLFQRVLTLEKARSVGTILPPPLTPLPPPPASLLAPVAPVATEAHRPPRNSVDRVSDPHDVPNDVPESSTLDGCATTLTVTPNPTRTVPDEERTP